MTAPAARWTAPFLIASAALLGTALFLETEFARHHGGAFRRLHEHFEEPRTIHALGVGAMLLSLCPTVVESIAALRARRWTWTILPSAVAAGGLIAGGTMVGALTAFVAAAASAIAVRIARRDHRRAGFGSGSQSR